MITGLINADTTPQHAPLFEDIANYHLASGSTNGATDDEPASKKRKLPNGTFLPITGAQKNQLREVLLEARDISFSLPQRKKLHLGIAQYGTDINSRDTTFVVFTRNPASNEIDLEVPLSHFAYALRLPVPEKATKQYNFILLPKPELSSTTEPIIWTVNAGPMKSCHIPNTELSKVAGDPDNVLETALGFVLRQSGTKLTLPTDEEFSSAIRESHRKGDTAYHVKAFRGSKDGYLFFLNNGIFFGFKKPLAFFAFEDVESISYSSVLQRTFNLNIAHRSSTGSADAAAEDVVQEIEFSMIDQADYAGIGDYVKRHGLQDASLAEARRAKKLAKGKASTQNGLASTEGEDDTRTELEKAQQQLDDEEDEEEEDYDPGSDEESEGSGSSDDDEEYDREFEKARKKMKGKDLVKEELGSEAEDVSVSDDEEDEEEPEGEEDEGQDDDEDEEDVKEEEVEVEEPMLGQDDGKPAGVAVPTHGGRWASFAALPDPYDEDQL